jgi:glycosyltransferase involved in cell wall biosynthesis
MLNRQESKNSSEPRVGYVVKRYPRYSETFIVNEILAHEASGRELDIFALRPPNDTHFQDAISRVRSPVCYLPHAGLKGRDFWKNLQSFIDEPEKLAPGLAAARGYGIVDVHQGLLLAKEVRARGITHLHAHFATSPTTVARLAAHFAGIGFSFTAHAKDIFHEDVDESMLVDKLANAGAVITVSDFNEAHLRRISAGREPNILRIYNGLDLESFRFSSPLERSAHVIAVGRLVEKKGFDVLVEACAIMASKGIDFDCSIIGTGPLEAELRSLIEARGLQGRVSMPGPLAQSDMRGRVQDAAVMAAPCIVGDDGNRDGLPTTLLESMALGTPAISTDVTGIPEAIRHGETGIIVPQHDAQKLADALTNLLAEPRKREQLAQNARKLIEAEFDAVKSATRMRTVFSDVAARLGKG